MQRELPFRQKSAATLDYTPMILWHNGQFGQSAVADISSAGLSLGWGVFSTLGIQSGRALWLPNHLARLRRDAARCEITFDFSDEELSEAFTEVVRVNGVQNGLARLTLSRRDDGRWNTDKGSDFSIMARETPPLKSEDLAVRICPAPDLGPLRGVKTTSYLPYLWCWREAQRRGFDEAILFDAHGQVVEASRSSVFWVRDGVLGTAPLSLGPLDGVGREIILRRAKEMGLETREEALLTSGLKECDEVFLVSGASGPRSVSRVEETALPTNRPLWAGFVIWWREL